MLYILIAILAGGLVLYAVVASGSGTKKKRHKMYRPAASSRGYRGSIDAREVRARLDNIMAISRTGASGLKSAVTEADKLYDYVMKQLGYQGDTMGERLKSSQTRYSSYQIYDAVWRAHKLRNSMAHDIAFDLVPSQATEALRNFERGLKDLGAL